MFPIVETEFTPLASLFGGVLIGLSAVMVMLFFGRIAGIVGITGGALSSMIPTRDTAFDWAWRLAFVAGLITAPLIMMGMGHEIAQTVPSNLFGMAAAGLLVGVGTAMGSGCTSGHGVCGLARLSPRSLAAVLTFMAFAGATVFVIRHVVGG